MQKNKKTASDHFYLCSDSNFHKLSIENVEAVKTLYLPKAQGVGSTKTLRKGANYT